MKKFLKSASLILVLVLILANTVCVFADALPINAEPVVYDASTGEFIIYDLQSLGYSTLPANIFQGMENMIKVVKIKDENVFAIEQSAFLNLFRLEKVYIPASVEVIEDGAFWGCKGDLKIYAPRKSAAEYFAKENGYTYKEYSGEEKDTEGSVSEGIAVTILGMGIVFLILIILCIVLKIFEIAFGPKKKAPVKVEKPQPAPVAAPAPAADDTELVAVITAAIAASMGTTASSFRIKSLRRLGSSWNQAAKLQNFNNNF